MAAILTILAVLIPIQESDLKAKIRLLIQRLESDSIEERERATKDLATLGETALQDLESAAKQSKGEASNRIRSAINAIKEGLYLRDIKKSDLKEILEKYPDILSALATGSVEDRQKMIVRIGGIQRTSRGVADDFRDRSIKISISQRGRLLVEFLGRKLTDVSRVEALHALYIFNRKLVEEGSKPVLWPAPAGEEAAFLATTAGGTVQDRVVATTVIAGLGGSAAEDQLVVLATDENPNVRYVALRGLQARGASKRAPFILERAKSESDEYCFSAALEILAYWGGPGVGPFLADVFNNKDGVRVGHHSYEKSIAAWALGRLGYRPAADDLSTLLESSQQVEVTCGAKALAVLGDSRHASKLAPLLANTKGNWADDRAWVRWDAAAGLARMGNPAVVKDFRTLIAGDDADARTQAAGLLLRAGETVDSKVLVACIGEKTPALDRLLVALNRIEKPDARVEPADWRIQGWHYATGVNWANADNVHRGVQLHFLYRAERTAEVGSVLKAVAAATALELAAGIPKATLDQSINLKVPFPDPTVEELLIALAATGNTPILDGRTLRVVPVAEAVEYWKKKLGDLK